MLLQQKIRRIGSIEVDRVLSFTRSRESTGLVVSEPIRNPLLSSGVHQKSTHSRAGTMLHELLVIEDADVHLSILRKIAVQAGFATTGVNSVDGALNVLRRRNFECITLDLNLGQCSGTEVLQLLADMKSRVPVLIISGSDQTRDITIRTGKILDLNVYPPFSKPVDLALLRQTLRQIAADADRQRLGKASIR